MMERFLEMLIPYGVFGVAFFGLLHRTDKRNELREDMYHKTIKKNQEVIVKQAQAFAGMSRDIKDIKGMVIKIKDQRQDE